MLQNFRESGFAQFFNDAVERASELPGVLNQAAYSINSDIIDTATKERVEQNIRQTEAQRIAAQAGGWLSRPLNLIMAFVGVVGLLLFIRQK